jgi:hypothetical protein
MIMNRCSSLLTRSAALTLFVIALPGIACAFDPYGTWMRPSTGTQVNFYRRDEPLRKGVNADALRLRRVANLEVCE